MHAPIQVHRYTAILFALPQHVFAHFVTHATTGLQTGLFALSWVWALRQDYAHATSDMQAAVTCMSHHMRGVLAHLMVFSMAFICAAQPHSNMPTGAAACPRTSALKLDTRHRHRRAPMRTSMPVQAQRLIRPAELKRSTCALQCGWMGLVWEAISACWGLIGKRDQKHSMQPSQCSVFVIDFVRIQ